MMGTYDKGIAQPDERPARSKSAILGITALVAAIVALAFAVLPANVIQPPVPTAPETPADEVPEVEPKGRFNFKWKSFSFSFGKRDEPVDEAALREHEEREKTVAAARQADALARSSHQALLRWLTLISAGFALVGLTIGPVAWARERHPVLAGSAMAISSAALLWQYIIVGIVVGVAVLIILAFISSFAS
jgi:hypothetical protein